MNKHDAKAIVELVIDELFEMKILTEDQYGKITADQTLKLAAKVEEHANE